MAKEPLYAFNRGIVSPLAQARVDLKRLALSAAEQTNFLPRTLGPMSLRPGMQYLGSSYAATRMIPFIFAVDDTALIELSAGQMRVWASDTLVSRAAVSTAITNGTFTGNITGWTDKSDTGCGSYYYSGAGGCAQLIGDSTGAGALEQAVTVAAGDIGVVHALSIYTYNGMPQIRVGSTSGGEEYLATTTIAPGYHNITFTPTGTFYVRILNRQYVAAKIGSVTIAAAGTVVLTTPWTTTQQFNDIRFDQSADVIFVACDGVRPQRIERRASNSWSVVDFRADFGPFRAVNSTDIKISAVPSAGGLPFSDVTLSASRPFFEAAHVGSLFRVTSGGQYEVKYLSQVGTYSRGIRVSGVGTTRNLHYGVSGVSTWVGTIAFQRSVGIEGLWTDVSTTTLDVDVAAFNDTFDNQIIYYRLYFKSYTSGTVVVTLDYAAGATTGVGRVTHVDSSTQAGAEKITSFNTGVSWVVDWSEGAWSAKRGFPSAVGLHEGRLWFAGKNKQWGSVSDDYANFDDTTDGDSGPISRSIGTGPLDKVRWLVAANRLILGGQGAEWTARSSNLDEPLTPTNFGLKAYTNRGSGSVSGLVVDKGVLFVDRSESRMYELVNDSGEYAAVELTAIAPEVCQPSVVRLVAQRLPDTRVHAVLSDGTVALLVYDKVEDVSAWVKVVTDGLVLDAAVLPGTNGEDQVYYVVQRTVGGSAVNYLEKWAKASESVGGVTNKLADSFVYYSGAATATITGLTHLEGRTVVCWADGVDKGTFVVSGGAIMLPAPTVTTATVGLTYRARFQSTKLGYLTQGGPSLAAYGKNKVSALALLLVDTHAQGLKYGTDFDYLDDMPLYEDSAAVDQTSVWAEYLGDPIGVNGTIDNNTKLCLEANAPRPCTVLACITTVSD